MNKLEKQPFCHPMQYADELTDLILNSIGIPKDFRDSCLEDIRTWFQLIGEMPEYCAKSTLWLIEDVLDQISLKAKKGCKFEGVEYDGNNKAIAVDEELLKQINDSLEINRYSEQDLIQIDDTLELILKPIKNLQDSHQGGNNG